MKITKLPGVDDEILLELLSKSIHTGQELLEYTSSEELMKTLEGELLTLEELGRIRRIALKVFANGKISALIDKEDQELAENEDRELAESKDKELAENEDQELPDYIDPDLCNMLYSLHLNTGDLPGFSKYLGNEILEMPVRNFREACGTVRSRREFAEAYGLSEKTVNKLIIYVNLLETYEEDRDKLEIHFTKSLFIRLRDISDIDKTRVQTLKTESVDTVYELEDILSNESRQIDLTEKTEYSRIVLTNILKKTVAAESALETPEEIKTRLSIDPLRIIYRYMSIDNDKIEEIWKKNTSLRTLKAFQEMTRTIKDREEIEKRTALGNFEAMAVIADLLNIPVMMPWDAFNLYYGSKINSVKNLAKIEFIRDGIILDVSANSTPTSRVIPYIIAARNMNTGFESRYDPPDPIKPTPREIIEENGKISLSEMLTQLGKGIGQAQRELDLNALEMQKEILTNRDLSEYGLQPTWFTMPEIDFSLKMEYDVVSTETGEGTLKSRYVDITPINAKYKNSLDIVVKEESSLTIKFVPVPPIEAFVQRREVPDMTKMTVAEANAILAERGIKATLYTALNLPPEFSISDDKTEVTYQSVKPGEYLGIGEGLFILATYRKRVQSV